MDIFEEIYVTAKEFAAIIGTSEDHVNLLLRDPDTDIPQIDVSKEGAQRRLRRIPRNEALKWFRERNWIHKHEPVIRKTVEFSKNDREERTHQSRPPSR